MIKFQFEVVSNSRTPVNDRIDGQVIEGVKFQVTGCKFFQLTGIATVAEDKREAELSPRVVQALKTKYSGFDLQVTPLTKSGG